jgi:hypothetical protein
MSKIMFDYTKSILERVSFDPILFCKELEKPLEYCYRMNWNNYENGCLIL